MSRKKKHGSAPVPPGNQPKAGPKDAQGEPLNDQAKAGGGAPGQEQDPKRRLGNFTGAGEHPYQQPGGLNDANH